MRTLIHGLRRLMLAPWCSRRTSWGWSRSRSRSRRRTSRLALQLAFGLCGSVCGSWSSTWVGPCGGVPTATGAPSHTHGLSFTRKLQPMSTNSPRSYLSEVVVAASGPGGGGAAGRGGRRGRRSRLCRSSSTPRRLTLPGPTATVPAARGSCRGASDTVHPWSGGRSCCAVDSTGAELVQVQFLDSGRCPCCASH